MARPVWGLLLLLLTALPAAAPDPQPLWAYPALDRVTGLAVSPNESLVATQGGVLARVGANGTAAYSKAVGLVQRMATSADGSDFATVSGLEVALWSRNFDPLWTYRAPAVVEAVAVAAGGERVAVGDGAGTLVLLDRQGRPTGGGRVEGSVGALSISQDGRSLVASIPGSLLLLDDRAQVVERLPAREATALALSADGSTIALGGADGGVRLLDRDGRPLWTRALDPPVGVSVIALSARGSLLLVSAGNDVVAFGRDGATLWRQTFLQPVQALALSQDGSVFAAAVRGGLVQAYDTGLQEEAAPAPSPSPAAPATEPPTSPTPAAPPESPPPPPAPAAPEGGGLPPPLLAGLAAAALLGSLTVLHRKGLVPLPRLPPPGRALRLLGSVPMRPPWPRRSRRAAGGAKVVRAPVAPRRARGPSLTDRAARAALRKWETARSPVPRTPPVDPTVARLLRSRAREERTLENLETMRAKRLISEERHRALKEEAMARLAEAKRKLNEAGYRE